MKISGDYCQNGFGGDSTSVFRPVWACPVQYRQSTTRGGGVNGNDDIYLPCAIVTVAFPRGGASGRRLAMCPRPSWDTTSRHTKDGRIFTPKPFSLSKSFSSENQFPVNDGSVTMPTDRLSSNVHRMRKHGVFMVGYWIASNLLSHVRFVDKRN